MKVSFKSLIFKDLFILLFSLVALGIFFSQGLGKAYIEIWQFRILSIFVAIMFHFAIYIIGYYILSRFAFTKKIRKRLLMLISYVVGLFIVTTIILILGTYGLISKNISILALIIINALGWKEGKYILSALMRKCSTSHFSPLIKSAILFFLLLLIINFFHCFVPPIDYDVLEYHLGVPSEYLKHGKIHFIANNVYANFPQLTETMAFYLMTICGKFYGAIASKISIWFFGILLSLSLYTTLRNFYKREACILSTILIYMLPWTNNLSRLYYVEIPMTFMIILSIHIFIQKQIGLQRYILSGFILGVATGIKYNVLFMGIPSFFFFVLLTEINYKEKCKCFIFLFLGFLFAFLPWMMRNFINTGNPIYPLFNNIIIPGYWSDIIYTRFRIAHAPSHYNIHGIIMRLIDCFFISYHASPLHYLLVMPAIFFSWKKFRSFFGFISIWILLWIIFTHRMERFLYCVFVILCFPMGAFLLNLWEKNSKKILIGILICFTSLNLYQNISLTISGAYDTILGFKTKEQFLETYHTPYKAEKYINQNIKGKILIIGEARTFYISPPLIYNTVFDKNIVETLFQNYSLKKIHSILQKNKILFIYINWNEVMRLTKNYTFTFKGNTIPGFLWINRGKLITFLKQYCRKIYPKEEKNEKLELYKIR